MNIKQLALKYEEAKKRLDKYSSSSLQITDNREIIADGCKKIVNCNESLVVIEQRHNRITVTGDGLKLRNWGSNGVIVTGVIASVEFDSKPHSGKPHGGEPHGGKPHSGQKGGA